MKIILIISSIVFAFAGWSQIKSKLNKEDFGKLKPMWEELGPNYFPGTDKEHNLTGTGPVYKFMFHPKDSNICVTNSTLGGIFISKNGGKDWFSGGSDKWDRSMCAWFDMHPEDQNTIVALSIDEASKAGNSIGFKGGLMLTTDFGQNWKKIATYKNFGSPYTFLIKVILTKDSKCFVATTDGLFYLENIYGPKNWVNLTPGRKISDIELKENQLLLSSSTLSDAEWKIQYLNIENPKELNEVAFGADPMRLKNIRFKWNPSKENSFFYLAQFDRKTDLLLSSNLKGESEILNDRMMITFGGGFAFAIDPHNSDKMYCSHGIGVRKSEDGGKTWKGVQGKFHVDMEYIYFSPFKDEVFLSTHGGLYKSSDDGETWQRWSKGISNAEVMGIGVGKDGTPIAIGLFHDGSLVYNSEKKWVHKEVGDGLNSIVSQDDNRYVYISNQHGAGGVYVSKDSGVTFTNINRLSKFRTSGWSMSFVSSPGNSKYFFFNYKRKNLNGISDGFDVVLSKNRGLSDFHIISDFNQSHGFTKYNLFNLWVNPNKPSSLYAYLLVTENGKLEHRLFRNDSTLIDSIHHIHKYWEEIEMATKDWTADIQFNPLKDEEIFYIKSSSDRMKVDEDYGSGMVYKADFKKKVNCYSGKNCKDITWNLPNARIEKLGTYVDRNKNRLYVGTTAGVYYLDLVEMDEWVKLGDNLPNIPITGIQSSGDGKFLYVGTRGRGVWRIAN